MATIIGRTDKDIQVAIANWLLDSNVRIGSGRHQGAIAGWLDEHNEPSFAYPEITGYYLSWLASVARLQPNVDVRSAAVAAVDWLHRITSPDNLPATRYYFFESDDWRNNATFTFDLAMICRGLHAVRGVVPERPRKGLLQKLLRRALPPGNTFRVFIDARQEVPDRWSTRPGPFQLKTAAALLPLEEHPAIWNTFYRWRGRVLEYVDAGELHAAFYSLEGLMQFAICGEPAGMQETANCFDALFPFIDDTRSDVVAQALRLGRVLRSFGFLQGKAWSNRLEELRLMIEGFISDSGAVSFCAFGRRPTHFNTWAAIFAYQCFAHDKSD